jgi:transcriptional regulator with XRE-family HTH domain
VRARGKTLGAIDMHVASRVRERRMVLGMSQTKLAATLGLTFQQVYKYEQGKNRISAGRLYDLSKLLGVPITFFFEGIVGSYPTALLASGRHNDPLDPREATELFAAYRAISDSAVRRRLRQLAKAFAEGLNGSTATTPPSRNRKPSRRLRTDRGRGATKR